MLSFCGYSLGEECGAASAADLLPSYYICVLPNIPSFEIETNTPTKLMIHFNPTLILIAQIRVAKLETSS